MPAHNVSCCLRVCLAWSCDVGAAACLAQHVSEPWLCAFKSFPHLLYAGAGCSWCFTTGQICQAGTNLGGCLECWGRPCAEWLPSLAQAAADTATVSTPSQVHSPPFAEHPHRMQSCCMLVDVTLCRLCPHKTVAGQELDLLCLWSFHCSGLPGSDVTAIADAAGTSCAEHYIVSSIFAQQAHHPAPAILRVRRGREVRI